MLVPARLTALIFSLSIAGTLLASEGTFDEESFVARLESVVMGAPAIQRARVSSEKSAKACEGIQLDRAAACLSLGDEAFGFGRRDCAQQAYRHGLALDPMHPTLLHRVGFDLKENRLVPRIDELLNNGWWLSKTRWAPSKDFDFSSCDEVGKSVRAGVLGLRKQLGNEGFEASLASLKTEVAESGIMAAPALTRLTRGGDPEVKTIAYGLLAPLKPEFMDAELMAKYPHEKDPRVAAGMAGVIAKIREGETLPAYARGAIQKSPLAESARWSQLAAQMNDKSCIPLILNRWKLLNQELITMPGGARNVITIVQQQAYIRDLTAVVNVGIGLFDPDIGYIQSGTVLDVRIVKVEIFRSTLQALTNTVGFNPEDFE